MSSYLSKSRKAFKPKAPSSRPGAAVGSASSPQSSIRGSVDRQTQTPQPSHLQLTAGVELRGANEPFAERVGQLTPSAVGSESIVGPPHALPIASLPTPTRQDSDAASAQIQTQRTAWDQSLPRPQPQSPGPSDQANNVRSNGVVQQRQQEERSARRSSRHQKDTESRSDVSQNERALPSPSSIQRVRSGQYARGASKASGESRSSSERQRLPPSGPSPSDASQPLSAADVASLQAAIQTSQPLSPAIRNEATPRTPSQSSQRRLRTVPSNAGQSHQDVVDEAANAVNDEPAAGEARPRRRAGKRKREPTPDEFECSEIAPTVVRMTDLIKDTRMGKKSARERKLQERDRQVAQKKLEEAQEQAREQAQDLLVDAQEPAPPPSNASDGPLHNVADARAVASALTQAPPEPAARLAPRVRLVNGQIVQDEESRVVDRHAATTRETRAGSDDSAVVSEDELTRRINSGSYMRRERHTKWTPDETELFYEGLRMFGTDFMTISKIFPGRTRRQIKLKFNKEERAGPEGADRVRRALHTERRPADLAQFEQLAGFVLRDPEELQIEMDSDRKKLEDEQAKESEELHAIQLEREAAAKAEAEGRGGARGGAVEQESQEEMEDEENDERAEGDLEDSSDGQQDHLQQNGNAAAGQDADGSSKAPEASSVVENNAATVAGQPTLRTTRAKAAASASASISASNARPAQPVSRRGKGKAASINAPTAGKGRTTRQSAKMLAKAV